MWAQCYSASNNIHFDAPPIMADGRIYSSYQPQATVNDNLRAREGIKTNWEYRRYLVNHADEICKFNCTGAINELGLPVHTRNGTTSSANTPFLFASTFDTNRPAFGYTDSDLKNPYLSREQLQARLTSPSVQNNA